MENTKRKYPTKTKLNSYNSDTKPQIKNKRELVFSSLTSKVEEEFEA